MKNLYNMAVAMAFALFILVACTSTTQTENHKTHSHIASSNSYSNVELRMQKQGLVDIVALDSSIAVHLVYSTPYNFMGRQLYKGLNRAFMLPEVATRLIDANKRLKEIRPDLNFIVYDAARPISIQHEMWDMVKETPMRDFVCDPTQGQGMHNYGAAIDLTLIDCTGQPLQMGSTYDYFGDESRVSIEDKLLAEGRITSRELENRKLLRRVMVEAGFKVFDVEWWHFNLVTPDEAKESLKVIE